jgi:hypothetical protein
VTARWKLYTYMATMAGNGETKEGAS